MAIWGAFRKIFVGGAGFHGGDYGLRRPPLPAGPLRSPVLESSANARSNEYGYGRPVHTAECRCRVVCHSLPSHVGGITCTVLRVANLSSGPAWDTDPVKLSEPLPAPLAGSLRPKPGMVGLVVCGVVP